MPQPQPSVAKRTARGEELVDRAVKNSSLIVSHFRNNKQREGKFKLKKLATFNAEFQAQQKSRAEERRRTVSAGGPRPSSSNSAPDLSRTAVDAGARVGAASAGTKRGPPLGRCWSSPAGSSDSERRRWNGHASGPSPVHPLALGRLCASCPVSGHPVPHPGAQSLKPHRRGGRGVRRAWEDAVMTPPAAGATPDAAAGGQSLSSAAPPPRSSMSTPSSPKSRPTLDTSPQAALSPARSATSSATAAPDRQVSVLSLAASGGTAAFSSGGRPTVEGGRGRLDSSGTMLATTRSSSRRSTGQAHNSCFRSVRRLPCRASGRDRTISVELAAEEEEEHEEDDFERRLQAVVDADALARAGERHRISADPPGAIERLGKLMALFGPRYKTLPRGALWEKAAVEEEGPTKRRIHAEALKRAAQIVEEAGPKPPNGGAVRVPFDIDHDGEVRRRWLDARRGLMRVKSPSQIAVDALGVDASGGVAAATHHQPTSPTPLRGAHNAGSFFDGLEFAEYLQPSP